MGKRTRFLAFLRYCPWSLPLTAFVRGNAPRAYVSGLVLIGILLSHHVPKI